jgi:uncharacterized phage-associated protein
MHPQFREAKTAQAAGLLLTLRGGRMSYMKLVKLLYLADREALIRWGRPITFDRYVSMDRGPVLSRTFDLLSEGGRPGEQSAWERCISPPAHYDVSLRVDCGTDQLSEAEEAVLREVFERFGRRTRWDLVDYVHTLPEWTDPHGSAIPITYRDILAGAGKTEIEIAQVENELEELALLDAIL